MVRYLIFSINLENKTNYLELGIRVTCVMSQMFIILMGITSGPQFLCRLIKDDFLAVKIHKKRSCIVTVCFYYVMYAFQSESTLYICLNVKELLARNWHRIWSLSDCNWTKWLSVRLRARCWRVRVPLESCIISDWWTQFILVNL